MLRPDFAAINERLRSAGAEFALFDRVNHVVQCEGKAGIVTGVQFREGAVVYLVTWSPSASESGHFAAELELVEGEPWAF
jgi:hypothetical protein